MLAGIPATIGEAVETLIEFCAESLPEIHKMPLKEFVESAHFGAGMFIRNTWYHLTHGQLKGRRW